MTSILNINSSTSTQHISLPQITDFISNLNHITFHSELSNNINLSIFTSSTNLSSININNKKLLNHNQVITNNKYIKSYIDIFNNTSNSIFSNKNISNIYPINDKTISPFLEITNLPKKTKPKGKELKVVKLGQIGLNDSKYNNNCNNNCRRSPPIEMRKNIKNTITKTIILNKEQVPHEEGISPKFHSGGNSPLTYHNNSNIPNDIIIKKKVVNKSPQNKGKINKVKGSPLTHRNVNEIKVKAIAKSPPNGKYKKQTTYNKGNNNNLECSKIILNNKPNTIHYISISPKPGSPTEMHDEMKSNIGSIKKTSNNQSLAYPSSKHHKHLLGECDSSLIEISEKPIQIKKHKQKKSPIISHNTISKHANNNTNNDKRKRNNLNKSFDCFNKGINVFDSSDNIFEYVNNTIIEPTPKQINKNKNSVLQHPGRNFTSNTNNVYYEKPIGIRFTGKFNKNISTHNKNNITVDYDESSFDRFSFKNHFLP